MRKHASSLTTGDELMMRDWRDSFRSGAALAAVLSWLSANASTPATTDWREYAGGPGRDKYSSLDQINRDNVAQLERVWTHNTGDMSTSYGFMEANPLVIDGVLYATTAKLKVIALDPTSGRQLWRFDPYAGGEAKQTLNRGVAYWRGSAGPRILFTAGHFLQALDARTGKLDARFGDNGYVDLRVGLRDDPSNVYVDATSPGVVYKDLIIIGTRTGEGVVSAPGHIRAYDLNTGKVRWTFHTIPKPGEYGYETWPENAWRWAGGANAWGGVSLDRQRGIVFASTGSATYDFWGGNRAGDNLFANSVIALDANTGKRVWHFQTIHHDIWDRDLPTPPTLVTVRRDGRAIDAAAQVTKQGVVFLFERATGKPLFPIEERPVPAGAVAGEVLSATQPFPLAPPPLSRQEFRPQDANDLDPKAHKAIVKELEGYRLGPAFTPPSTEGTVMQPWMTGSSGWGGAAFDPSSRMLYVNSNDIPTLMKLLPIEAGLAGSGRATYLQNCAGCHGAQLQGNGRDIPSLVGVGSRLDRRLLFNTLRNGRGQMPGFAALGFAQLTNVMDYLYGGGTDIVAESDDNAPHVPFVLDGMTEFVGPDGYPAIKPPWGKLSAVDLDRGSIAWQVPLGEYPELKARGVPQTGTKNIGAPIVTAGGIVFIGATMDEKFRAFDAATGKLLWETELPGSAFAIPSTYMANGRQYVVIAAGGGKGRKTSDAFVAFALPVSPKKPTTARD